MVFESNCTHQALSNKGEMDNSSISLSFIGVSLYLLSFSVQTELSIAGTKCVENACVCWPGNDSNNSHKQSHTPAKSATPTTTHMSLYACL